MNAYQVLSNPTLFPETYGVAMEVASSMVDDGVPQAVAFDPSVILVIIEIIMQLLDKCDFFTKHPERVNSVAQNPNFFQLWSLTKQVKSAYGDWRAYKKFGGREVVSGLLKVGSVVSVSKVENVVGELQG